MTAARPSQRQLDGDRLDQALRRVDAALLDVVGRMPAVLRSTIRPLIRGGKRLRATMTWSCSATSGASDDQRIIELMTSVELLHAATLIHDDVIDGAGLRRGQPTVHASLGVTRAIVAGDRMIAESLALAARVDPAAMDELAETLTTMCDAQSDEAEVAFEAGRSVEHVLRVAAGKTGRLFQAACACGALLSELPVKERDAIARFGSHFGLGYQLLDDIDDLVDGTEDLTQGVYTLPVVLAAESDERVAGWLSPDAGSKHFEAVVQSAHVSGAIGRAAKIAEQAFDSALAALDGLGGSEAAAALGRIATSYRTRCRG